MTARSTYVSGWCGSSRHDRCLGAYAGTGCCCPCHTAPPPELPRVVTVHCFFGCLAVVESADAQEAHHAMEAHYVADHWADIRAAVGWKVPA